MIAMVICFIFGCSRHALVQRSPDMKARFLIRHVKVPEKPLTSMIQCYYMLTCTCEA